MKRLGLILGVFVVWGCSSDETGAKAPGNVHQRDMGFADMHQANAHMPDAHMRLEDAGNNNPQVVRDLGTPDFEGLDLGEDLGDPHDVVPVAEVQVGALQTSPACAACHSNDASSQAMRDSKGREIAPFDLWQGTMMANSARDPLWRAVVSAEAHRFPEAAEAIEAKCMRCHAPMASELSDSPKMADLAQANDLGHLGADGVSCAVCHGIEAEGLGTPASFSGGWAINDQGAIYGPHKDNLFAMPMEMRTQLTPTGADHTNSSEMCASCHTLYTTPLDDAQASPFPEQTPYLEWKNSDFANGQTCQSCHVPTTDADGGSIRTRIARRPGGGDFPRVSERDPYGRHIFVGGNTLIPQILRQARDLLRPQASDAALQATEDAARAQLQNQTAMLTLRNTTLNAGTLSFTVDVRNLAGHKMPTGFPARRAWLQIEVFGANDQVLLASGLTDERGRILGADGAVHAAELRGGATLPHYQKITSADEVQIYEAHMADKQDKVTFSLMSAHTYAKDNRLLPSGWRDDFADIESVKPHGTDGDVNFGAGGDQLEVELSDLAGAKRVVVRLVYQPLGARWAAELLSVPTADVLFFAKLYQDADAKAVTVAETSMTLN